MSILLCRFGLGGANDGEINKIGHKGYAMLKGSGCNYSHVSFDCQVDEGRELLKYALEKLAEYEDAEEQGLLLRLPCKVGDTVYVLAECNNINLVLDGTMYDSSGGYGTATGYYCPYELNEKCPHKDFDCCESENKTAVFEDTVTCIDYEETGITLQCLHTNVCGYIGEYIFLTREEAEKKLKEMESD